MLWWLKPLTQHREFTMDMVIREVCPRCKSATFKKNGHIYNGKQNQQCKDCGRQCVDCFEQHLVSDETRDLIERLLLECISLRGICRAVKVGLKWLLGFVEVDEMASFVQKKANKQWIWLAMDVKTRQIIAFHVDDRSRKSARKLWAKIPVAYRQQATFYTDQSVVYEGVIPHSTGLSGNRMGRMWSEPPTP
jgi:insertion element IS1 protein InsB